VSALARGFRGLAAGRAVASTTQPVRTPAAGEQDLELEVTDLPSRASLASGLVASAWRAPVRLTRALQRTAVQQARAALPRQWVRRRLIGAAVAGGALLLTLVIVLNVPVSGQSLLGVVLHLFPTTPPTPALAPGEDTFFAQSTVPWGRLLVDGRRLAPAEIIEAAQPLTFELPRGTHTLEYQAAPFPTLRCQVSVPSTPADTCPLVDPSQSNPDFTSAARILDFRAVPDRLPSNQLAALVQAANAVVSAQPTSTAVLPGERYVAADSSLAVATTPLVATLTVAINEDPSNSTASGTGTPCATLCIADPSGQGSGAASEPAAWVVWAHVVLSWRYSTTGGQVLIPSAPAAPAPSVETAIVPEDPSVALEVLWDGHWAVTLSATGVADLHAMACQYAGTLFESLMAATSQPSETGWSGEVLAASVPAAGCLARLQPTRGDGTPVGTPAYVLYRFGVVLAANARARAFFPDLPVADAYEQALASRIAAQSPLSA
jgi:hypothetical protein